jgi:argininosuccinate synthase
MKINVTVDLEDFYTDEDGGTLADEVKSAIASSVKNGIWEKFKQEGLVAFSNQMERKITADKDLKIKETIDDLFKNRKIKKSSYSNELLSLEEFIVEQLNRNISVSRDFEDLSRKLVDNKSKEIVQGLKDRYDFLFASQIVSNLNKQGMLKEDIAKILLENNASQG